VYIDTRAVTVRAYPQSADATGIRFRGGDGAVLEIGAVG
jgi:hypothetical protein